MKPQDLKQFVENTRLIYIHTPAYSLEENIGSGEIISLMMMN